MCFKDINTKYVIIMDSDVIFKLKYNPLLDGFQNDKIIWVHWPRIAKNYTNVSFTVWEKSILGMTKLPMTAAYMANSFPFIALQNWVNLTLELILVSHILDKWQQFLRNSNIWDGFVAIFQMNIILQQVDQVN